jgi:RHS repeat-associated protein
VTNESSSVRVKSNGNPFTKAQTDKDKGFFGWVETMPGQNTLSIEATDDSPNANVRTQHFTINVTGLSRVPSYDFNGNMTANGLGQTYQWDAENRLVKITYADLSSTEFAYDGLSRRTRITEKNSANTITSDKRYIWSGGNQPAEERDATTNAVTKRFFAEGEQRIGGTDAGFYYYAKDHLGSVREITNSTGAIAARYDFDLWGKRTKISGTLDSEVGYTGHHHHAKSGLILTWYRAYDAEMGRWLSADPLGEEGGLNLYGYVLNSPTGRWDPLGQSYWDISVSFFMPFGLGLVGGIFIDDCGDVYPYIGVGIGTPGPGASIMHSSSSPSPGKWTGQVSGGFGLGGAYGFDQSGSDFTEYGFTTPGASVSAYYTGESLLNLNNDQNSCK